MDYNVTQTPFFIHDLQSKDLRSRVVSNGNGLDMRIIEAGFEDARQPCVLLLHGFPELAYSWRKVMGPIAAAGYHVVAPDQRGYGDTKGWTATYDGELEPFRMTNLVKDVLGLLSALQHREAIVIGHDFGSPVAAYCALTRPDVFRGVVLMSAPFSGAPATNANDKNSRESKNYAPDIHQALASLNFPRKHYQWYYSTPEADADMRNCRQGLHNFLRAYYHYKSADWTQNKPFPLASRSARELAKLPTYYIMELNQNMAETVAPKMPTPAEIEGCKWLTDDELKVYSTAFNFTGFQGGLQWYRCSTTGAFNNEMEPFAGKTIDVPSCFISGKSDWGVYQIPGAFERMQSDVLTDIRGCHLIDGAGHWVQQEQPEAAVDLVMDFLSGVELST